MADVRPLIRNAHNKRAKILGLRRCPDAFIITTQRRRGAAAFSVQVLFKNTRTWILKFSQENFYFAFTNFFKLFFKYLFTLCCCFYCLSQDIGVNESLINNIQIIKKSAMSLFGIPK
jgi:hypothetical protein